MSTHPTGKRHDPTSISPHPLNFGWLLHDPYVILVVLYYHLPLLEHDIRSWTFLQEYKRFRGIISYFNAKTYCRDFRNNMTIKFIRWKVSLSHIIIIVFRVMEIQCGSLRLYLRHRFISLPAIQIHSCDNTIVMFFLWWVLSLCCFW